MSTGTTQNLAIGLGAFGLALVLVGGWMYRRGQADGAGSVGADAAAGGEKGAAQVGGAGAESAPGSAGEASQEAPNTLMDAIIALDDLYQAGKLPEGAYQQRRAELKEKLKKLL